MSLFDVIKYPISIPPTDEEIKNLPDKIKDIIGNSLSISLGGSPRTNVLNHRTLFGSYIRIMLKQPINRENALHTIALARQALLELE